MSSDEDGTAEKPTSFGLDELQYIFTYWVAPPVILGAIAALVGVFLIFGIFAGHYLGGITDNTGFLLFFVVASGVALLAPPLSGGMMGYWKGMAWEVPVSVYFATVLVAGIFGRVDQAISSMFIQAPALAIYTGIGMVVAAYVFSNDS